MSFYDIFLDNPHRAPERQLLLALNRTVARFLLDRANLKGRASLLEIGPGKGYFYQACRELSDRIEYTAMDRNEAILQQLDTDNVILADATSLPDTGRRFDVIYAAYVIEHLSSGRQVYEFIQSCRRILTRDGLLALCFPDTVRMGMEFWNIDYTHLFPTTKRNVTMALVDNGFDVMQFYDVNGLLTVPYFDRLPVYLGLRSIALLYNYKFWNLVCSPVYRRPLSDLGNVFYRAYCLIREENVLVVARCT